jgi:2',3'-cyclic-nucleotide 2'-phosphodiesterase (5'-nucleotidase family)
MLTQVTDREWCGPVGRGSIGRSRDAPKRLLEEARFVTPHAPARPRLRQILIAVIAVLSLAIPTLVLAAKPDTRGQTTQIRILDISDWHGQLDPNPTAGGAEALSDYFKAERVGHPNTITLTAGDDFGATPPLSGFFDEIPAVRAERMMGIQVGTFGNHNFDAGIDHLQQMIDLAGSTTEVGAPFDYVSANLDNRDDNLTGVKDYKIFTFDGVGVAIIGLTNPEAPGLVFPGNFGTIVPSDPIAAANRARAAARAEGAKVFVVIAHMGIDGQTASGAFGPLVELANGLTGFDLIIGDHTNFTYQATINGALVVENLSKSLTYSRLDLTVQRGTGKVQSKTNTFVTPTAAGHTDPAIAAMLQPYRDALAPILNVQVGTSSVVIPRSDACGRSDGRLCESKIGDVITDAMRARYATDFAVTNSGGIRANLTCPSPDVANDFCPSFTPPPYVITRGQTFTVLPFGNFTVTVDATGAELKAMLENGVSLMPGAQGRFPQVSGLCFTYDIQQAAGSRVTGAVRQAADGSCTGAAVDLTSSSTYSIAMNDFMATGGDGYPRFDTARVNSDGTTLEQTLTDFVGAGSPLAPTIQGRITCTTSGVTVCPTILP